MTKLSNNTYRSRSQIIMHVHAVGVCNIDMGGGGGGSTVADDFL